MGKIPRTSVPFLAWIVVISGVRIASAADATQAPHTPVTPGLFVDITQKVGIHFRQQSSPTARKYLLETKGSGVALFDYDNDGRLDIFFTNGARLDDPTPKGTIPKKDDAKFWGCLYHQKPGKVRRAVAPSRPR